MAEVPAYAPDTPRPVLTQAMLLSDRQYGLRGFRRASRYARRVWRHSTGEPMRGTACPARYYWPTQRAWH
eukprot:3074007-Rhodomonas_salina.1